MNAIIKYFEVKDSSLFFSVLSIGIIFAFINNDYLIDQRNSLILGAITPIIYFYAFKNKLKGLLILAVALTIISVISIYQ